MKPCVKNRAGAGFAKDKLNWFAVQGDNRFARADAESLVRGPKPFHSIREV